MIRVGLKKPEMPRLPKINTAIYLKNFSQAHLNWEINLLEDRMNKKLIRVKS